MGLRARLGRSVFVAAAVGLAWGVRGDFGHVVGAMYPGAVLGLAGVAVAASRPPIGRIRMNALKSTNRVLAFGQRQARDSSSSLASTRSGVVKPSVYAP